MANRLIVQFLGLFLLIPNAWSGIFFEPKAIIEYSNWEQGVGGTALDGTLAGQSYRYGAGMSLLVTTGKIFVSASYNYMNVYLKYRDAEDFEADNSWRSHSSGVAQDIGLDIGFKMTNGTLYVGFIPVSTIAYSEYFIEGIEEAEFKGTCVKGGIGFKLGKSGSANLYVSSCSYDQAQFDGVEVKFPSTFETVDYESLKTTNIGYSLGILF